MDTSIMKSIKARIALLQLDQVGRNRPPPPPRPQKPTTPTEKQINYNPSRQPDGNIFNKISIPLEIRRLAVTNAKRNGDDLPTKPRPVSTHFTFPVDDKHFRETFKNVARPTGPTFTSSPPTKPNQNVFSPPKPKDSNVVHHTSPQVSHNSNTNCYACIDYSSADNHSAKFPRHNVSSIDKLAHDLTSPFSASPILKARAIFTWFHHNIAYDTSAYFGGNIRNKSPEETLRSGLAVCQGYAELYERLARSAGLEVMLISGHGKGWSYTPISNGNIPSYSSNHAWNAVKLNGKWQPIDPCWGAGSVEASRQYAKRFSPNFFTSTPEEFRIRHFPTKPEHQFCTQTCSWREYISMKEGPLIYTGFNETGLSEYALEPKFRDISGTGQSIHFVVRSKCSHTRIPPQDRVVLVLSLGGSLIPMKMEKEGSVWTAEVDAGSAKRAGNVQLSFIDRLGNRGAKGLTPEEFQRGKTREGYSWTGLAQWTVC